MTTADGRRGIGRRAIRSVVALLAGGITVIVLEVVGIYGLLHLQMTSGISRTSSILFFLGDLALAGAIGGFITARIARGRPVTHAGILGLLWWLVIVPDALKASAILPGWRLAGFVLIPLPGTLLGGLLAGRRKDKGDS